MPAASRATCASRPSTASSRSATSGSGSALQRTREATEAIFLLARHAFDDLGYRRLEWKCNAANAASRRAAERFGFTFEGLFRQHQIVKGRNRDTAWYAILDHEWPAIRASFEAWLDPANFDDSGHQRRRLTELRTDNCWTRHREEPGTRQELRDATGREEPGTRHELRDATGRVSRTTANPRTAGRPSGSECRSRGPVDHAGGFIAGGQNAETQPAPSDAESTLEQPKIMLRPPCNGSRTTR